MQNGSINEDVLIDDRYNSVKADMTRAKSTPSENSRASGIILETRNSFGVSSAIKGIIKMSITRFSESNSPKTRKR